MPFVHTVFREEQHVLLVGKGKVTASVFADAARQVAEDPAYLPHFTVLVDAREVVHTPENEAQVLEMAKVMADLKASFQNNVAIVARGSLLLMAATLVALVRKVTSIKMRVFVDMAAAEAFCRDGHAADPGLGEGRNQCVATA